jgi:hypothetical protein
MFAQQQQLGRGQLCLHKSYRLVDTWGRGSDGSALTKGARDAAIFADIDPGLQSRVFQAAKNSANGKSTPEDAALKDEITAMLEAGEIEPSVAAALLRTCNTAPDQETGFQVLNPSLSTRTDGASDAPTRYYNPFSPAGAGYKGAGDREFMDLLKGYMDSHGIGRRGSPARATAPALDLLRGLEAGRRNRHRQKGLAG